MRFTYSLVLCSRTLRMWYKIIEITSVWLHQHINKSHSCTETGMHHNSWLRWLAACLAYTCGLLCVGVMSNTPADGRFHGGRLVNVGCPALFKCFVSLSLDDCKLGLCLLYLRDDSLSFKHFHQNCWPLFVCTPVFPVWGASCEIGAQHQFYPSLTHVIVLHFCFYVRWQQLQGSQT